jgi:hypothetical protein
VSADAIMISRDERRTRSAYESNLPNLHLMPANESPSRSQEPER